MLGKWVSCLRLGRTINMISTEEKEQLINSGLICVFGIGALFNQCYSQVLLTLGKKPDFLCDNSPEKWGKVFYGVRCISPQELVNYLPNLVVIVAVRNYETISKQLKNNGVTNIWTVNFGRAYNVINNIQKIETFDEEVDTRDLISLKGKFALITGASRGIGFQVALALAKQGVNIIAHSRQRSHCDDVIQKCRELGVEAYSVQARLDNSVEVRHLQQEIDNSFNKVDILVNCAGVAPQGLSDIWQQKEKDYQVAFSVNALAPILLCSHFIPKMITNGFGRVINVSSNIHHRPAEMAYACSKAALDKYVYDISPSLDDTGVLISIVDPGWLRTDMGGNEAPYPVESVLPGAIIGAVSDDYDNGQWFVAQDYVGLSIFSAVKKSRIISRTL